MSNQCPLIVNSSVPQDIITIDNINEVRVDTTTRTVGTKVKLSCHSGRTLVGGAAELECVNDGGTIKWNGEIPKCALNTATTDSTTGLSEDELIVIGVVAAICILVIIMVIVMLCACWYKRRRERTYHKRAVSEYSINSMDYHGYKPYSMYAPFPNGRSHGGSIDRRSRYFSSSLPRSAIPGSFPRTSHPSAYEMQTRSAAIRPKPYVSYMGPRVARASSETYEDYVAERNSPNYRPYVIDSDRRGSYDNDGFRGEWTDRYDRKNFNDFNRDAYTQGRDPFLWDTRSPSSGF